MTSPISGLATIGNAELHIAKTPSQSFLPKEDGKIYSSFPSLFTSEDTSDTSSTQSMQKSTVLPSNQLHQQDSLATLELSIGSIEVLSLIGQGCFGVVYRARFKEVSKSAAIDVAVKINKYSEACTVSNFGLEELQLEAKILRHISFSDPTDKLPFARYVAAGSISENLYCLVQKLSACNLAEFISSLSGRRITLRSVAKMVYQLFQGLEFLEHPSRRIVHGDLKPQNILYDGVGAKIRIADFGLAQQGLQTNKGKDYLVTRYYRPPEIVFGLPYDCSVDRWSVACIAFEIYTQRPLFPATTSRELLVMFKQFLGEPQQNFLEKIPLQDRLAENDSACVNSTGFRNRETSFPFEDRKKFFQSSIYGIGVEESGAKKQFADCIKKWLRWEPLERPLPSTMIEDPFIVEWMKAK